MAGVSVLGPDWIKDLLEGKTDFLDPKWIELNTMLNDLSKYYQRGFTGNSADDLGTSFAFGQAGMVFFGVWGVGQWTELNPDLNVGFFMVPTLNVDDEAYAYVFVDGALSLTSNCPENITDSAIEVLKYTATPEFGTIFSEVTLNIPAVNGAIMPDVEILAEVNEIAANHASPYGYWVGSEFVIGKPSLYSDVLSPGMQKMYAGEMTPEELAQKAQDALSQWFKPLMERLGK